MASEDHFLFTVADGKTTTKCYLRALGIR